MVWRHEAAILILGVSCGPMPRLEDSSQDSHISGTESGHISGLKPLEL